ncbi:nuclear pore complex protein Nup214-like [Labeo rohita]|uniref:Nuclear pore complex protein Nup214 n=1 Tax=Labeo rohita TaxID=84645 RepID=A0A498M2G5_LABRO|nr:nuclear pore complex protein Nup214-like [Labeo rohita]
MGDDPDSIPEREMKDFQFRQMKKIRVFESSADLPRERSSLLTISNKYGLTFAGRDKTLKVFWTRDVIAAGRLEGNPNETAECSSAVVVTVDVEMHHIALSSDELTLSVCGTGDTAELTLDFYDVRTFLNKQNNQDKRPFTSFRPTAAADTLVQDLKWSPVDASRLAVCLSDGSMMVLDVQDSVNVVAQLPASTGITCVCWSPKGKQVSAGKEDATVVQFTPNLQAKKVIPCPGFYSQDHPVKVLDVLWLSTYNFAVAYAAADGSLETPPELVVVSLPKKDEKRDERYLNFNDLVYGTCTERQHHYYLCHIEDWDLVLAASAAAIEVSIIAKQEDKSACFLASSADEKRLPPAPTLMLLSTDGVLCPFSLLNLNPGVQQLTVAPVPLPEDGERAPAPKSTSSSSAPVSAPSTIFPSFPASSGTAPPPATLSFTAPPPAATAATSSAPPTSASSTGFSFSLPTLGSGSSSGFSLGSTSAGFSFAAPKPSSEAAAFSFTSSTVPKEVISAPTAIPPQRPPAMSPIISGPKAPAEPATPAVRMNLTDRFLAVDSLASVTSTVQPFSLTSTPKPAAAEVSGPTTAALRPAAPAVLDVLWLSTYNFAVAYAAADGSLETPPELVVVSLPKKDEKRDERYLNFNDLVYGTCTERQHHYYLCHIEDWDLVLAASAAAIEVSIIAKQEDKVNWELWLLEDASRAELPVTENSEDTLPVGMAIDYTSQEDIHLSDEKRLPPAPTLMLLSTDGVLCPFSLLNLNPGVQQLTVAPVPLPEDGERAPAPKSTSSSSAPVSAPSTIFPSFPASSGTAPPPATLSFTAPPPAATAATSSAPPTSASSTGFSFSLPTLGSGSSSGFSLGSTSAGFSFAAPKPSSEAAAFSFTSSTVPKEVISAPTAIPPQRPPAMSPIISGPKAPAEPATPAVRMNLTDRFLAVDSLASVTSTVQPFSLTSTPKPAAAEVSGPTTAALRPAAPAVLTRVAQSSAPPVAPLKPAAVAPPATSAPSAQAVSVKALEKHLQQKRDSDPVMTGILEEIGHFEKELDDLKARCRNADFRVGSTEDMRDMRKESENLRIFTVEIKDTTESLHGDISMLKTNLLEGFAGAEEARAQSELNRDKDYLQLLYKKPLDPRREEQLKEIRRLYQYVKFAMEDVNDVLDVEWEKHLEKKKKQRHMIVPEREALFAALANNLDIINQQKQRLEKLESDLHKLRLYRGTPVWSFPSQTPTTPSGQSLDSELESLKDALLKASLETTPKAPAKSPSKMTPAKQSQLRNFLSKRQTPPVRSTAPVNLSRSAFLSPQFYEDLDEVSSSSSLSQPLEPEDSLAVAEEEDEPAPIPVMTHVVPRHPAVVRTPSIQPGFSMQSSPFSRVQTGPIPIISPVPKINMDSADSTALATKTVKHGAPPTEKITPTTIPAPQAAGRAALSRHMTSQKPGASLTESTLKTVPQVVNVQELKDKGPPIPVSTVISASVPAPAAQVVQQVLATVEANKNSFQGALKVPAPLAGSAQTTSSSFVFGGGAAKPDVGASSSISEKNSKGFSFTAP